MQTSILALFLFLAKYAHAYVPVRTLPQCTRTPPTQRFVCGQAGSYDPETKPILTLKNVTSVDACRIECLQEQNDEILDWSPTCFSIGFDLRANTCSLYNDTAKQSGFKASSSSLSKFYDFRCFDCLYTQPAQPGTNLLVNPGFEAPTSSRSPVAPFVNRASIPGWGTAAPGFRSAHALYMQENYVYVFQKLRLTPNSFYDIAFDYKIRFANTAAHSLRVQVGDSQFELIQPVDMAVNNTWQTFRGTIQFRTEEYDTPPWRRNISDFVLNVDNDVKQGPYSRFWIDNIVFTPSTLPFKSKEGTSIVKNGGWEQRTFAPWNVTLGQGYSIKNLTFESPGFGGSKSALLFDTSRNKYGDANLLQDLALNQTVALDPSTAYVLSFAFKFAPPGAKCPKSTFGDNFSIYHYLDDFHGDASALAGTRQYIRLSPALNYPGATEGYVTYARPVHEFSSLRMQSPTLGFFIFGAAQTDCALRLDGISIRERA